MVRAMDAYPTPFYRHIYVAARTVMRGAGAISGAPQTMETRTVYNTRPSLIGYRTTSKEEPTLLACFLLLLTAALFLLSLSIYVAGLAMHIVEAPVRSLLTSRQTATASAPAIKTNAQPNGARFASPRQDDLPPPYRPRHGSPD
jgi:hypothetical protein